jgi:hypothetical protein
MGREDPVLPHGTAISLRFEVGHFKAFRYTNGTRVDRPFNQFESCESWTCQVSYTPRQRVRLLISSHQVKTRDSRRVPHPIPREKLAQEVAKKLVAFLKVMSTSSHKFDVMTVVPDEASQARRDGHRQ